jgi:LysR family transcriptional activator of nhaA
MEWLNYHHLLYFWTVAREGSVSRASEQLRLAQPTVSGQIRALEESLGEKLFERSGRHLVLTDVGQVVYRYADEIFSLGQELMSTLRDRPSGRPLRLAVGITNVVPKLIAHRLLEPALRLSLPVQVACYEGDLDPLLARLAMHELDVVLADSPISSSVKIRGFNHLLGESGVVFCAAPALAASLEGSFPDSLRGAPMMLPTENTALRRSLDQWLDSEGIRPRIVAEFEDSALLKSFGQEGVGVIVVPTAVAKVVARQYGVVRIGRLDEVRERFYAISAERRLAHPAVVAISHAAREVLSDGTKPDDSGAPLR